MDNKNSIILEVCCGDVESVAAAMRGGADRIELCSALDVGGVTPSSALLEEAIEEGVRHKVPVNVLVRPRGGDFLYTQSEMRCIVRDVETAVKAGCAGVVFGALNDDGSVDTQACARVIDAARNAAGDRKVSFTFHRAFDMCRDPFASIEGVISLGFDRILTSGLAGTALEGANLLFTLREMAEGRISIMPGCGVNPGNVADILRLTRAREIHASAKEMRQSRMLWRRDDVEMGKDGSDEFRWPSTSEQTVKKLKNRIEEYIDEI